MRLRWMMVLVVGLGGGLVGMQAQTDAPVKVAGSVMAAQIVRRNLPIYPKEAYEQHINGEMTLRVVVGKDGSVEHAEVVSGPELLRPSSVEAVLQWRYQPYLLNGVPVEVETTVTFSEQLNVLNPTSPVSVPFVSSASNVVVAPLPPRTQAARRVRISGAVMAGQILSKVQPVYPKKAKQAHIAGTVELYAVIGPDGLVEQAKPVSGPEGLQQAAIDAVVQWRYKPYLLNGEAVEVDTTVTVNFNMN